MTQRYLEILGFHLQPQTHVPQAHRSLLKQSNLDSQMHKAFGKLVLRHQPSSKTFAIQMLHSSYSTIWLSTVVLQQSLFIVPHENPE